MGKLVDEIRTVQRSGRSPLGGGGGIVATRVDGCCPPAPTPARWPPNRTEPRSRKCVASVLLLLLVGCFSSDPGDRRFPCDESHGCPPGQVCTNNVCQEPAADRRSSAFD